VDLFHRNRRFGMLAGVELQRLFFTQSSSALRKNFGHFTLPPALACNLQMQLPSIHNILTPLREIFMDKPLRPSSIICWPPGAGGGTLAYRPRSLVP